LPIPVWGVIGPNITRKWAEKVEDFGLVGMRFEICEVAWSNALSKGKVPVLVA
jgi:hypothetical protein